MVEIYHPYFEDRRCKSDLPKRKTTGKLMKKGSF